MGPDRNSFSARLVVRPCPFIIKAYVKYLNHGMGAQLFFLTKTICFCYGDGEKLSLGGERERKTGIGQGCIIMHDFLNDMFSRQNENGGRSGRKGFIMDEKRAERIGTVMSLFLSHFARKVTRLFEQ